MADADFFIRFTHFVTNVTACDRIVRYFCHMNRLVSIIIFLCAAAAATAVAGPPKKGMVCGRVYLSDGRIITADGNDRVTLPSKKRDIKVVEDAYTHNARVTGTFKGSEIDSLHLWARTKPERVRTERYLDGYGWCWQLDTTPYVTIYAFSPKGYSLAGNGGMASVGKPKILVVIGGKITEFTNTHKMADDKLRHSLALMVADDPALADAILASRHRRDKTIRMLSLYNPAK